MEKIYRQGYDNPEDVAGIQKWTTIFGAITGSDTSAALETMTAALQNFRKEGETTTELAQRIADSWSFLGDAVATSAGDVGTAMGKVAGSAANVGVGLEQVSTWAALIMAKTQESAESVGNSLNSMITRYVKLTEKGFNSIIEDEEGDVVVFNDVAKALKQAGIEMYNAEDGFIDFGVVMDQIGEKWGDMSDALQKYIAFQMAGTRNMNRFITLMDNYAQSTQLTRDALLSEGTAMEKYSVWADSVTAAQNDLQNSLESLYATLLDGDTVKGFYNIMTGLVDGIDQAIVSTDKLNIAIPGVIAGIMGVVGAVQKLKAIGTLDGRAAFSLSNLLGGLSSSTGGIIAAAGAVFLVITGLVQLYNTLNPSIEKAAENTSKLSKALVDESKSLNGVHKKWDAFNDMADSSENAADKAAILDDVIQDITRDAPGLAQQFDLANKSVTELGTQAERTALALAELDKQQLGQNWSTAQSGLADAKRVLNSEQAKLTKIGNVDRSRYETDSYSGMTGLDYEFWALQQEATTLADYDEQIRIVNKMIDDLVDETKEYNDAQTELYKLQQERTNLEASIKESVNDSIRIVITSALNPMQYKDLSGAAIETIMSTIMSTDGYE